MVSCAGLQPGPGRGHQKTGTATGFPAVGGGSRGPVLTLTPPPPGGSGNVPDANRGRKGGFAMSPRTPCCGMIVGRRVNLVFRQAGTPGDR